MPNGYVCNQRYGVAIFDDPINVEQGWACVAGEPAFYISSTGDLHSSVIWLTNIDLKVFYKKGLSQSPKLRADGYLRTRLSSIIIELGLKYSETREQARILADLFSTIMQFSNLHFGLKKAPYGSLNNGVRQICIPNEQPLTLEIRKASSQATQPHVLCEKHFTNDDSELISLVFHRFSYANLLMSERIPVGNWERTSRLSLINNRNEFEDWLANLQRPGLIKIAINSVDSSVNHLVNYGSGAGFQAARTNNGSDVATLNQHTWVTTPEYRMLSKHADIKVEDVLLGEGFGLCPITIPEWGHYSENSYAFGLYCENLWTSLTRTLDGRWSKSPLSAWVHSLDRINCFQKAIQIDNSESVCVHSYGYGRITLQVPKSFRSNLPELALRQSMISPMLNSNETGLREVPKNATPAELMQIAMERGAIEFLERTNQAALGAAIDIYENKILNKSQNNILAL